MIHDDLLPAVAVLTGPDAAEALAPAVAAAGGRLRSARCIQVHYVVGRELVVRYRADVDWPAGRDRNETLLACTNRSGPLPGTVPVVADHDGGQLAVSVWRWPFDPLVPGLPVAVVPDRLAPLLTGRLTSPLGIEVVAYRPTERVVSRVTDGAGNTVYVKAMAPAAAAVLPERHAELRSQGIPAAPVLVHEPDAGVLVLGRITGPTLRDRIKQDRPPWPGAEVYRDLLDRLGRCADGPPTRASRTRDALVHGRLLGSLLPASADRLAAIGHRLEEARTEAEARPRAVIHGDLHEGQLITDDRGGLTGLLDIDDLGPGDPLDDPATLVGHLWYRSLTTADRSRALAVRSYAEDLRAVFAAGTDGRALDLTVAAVLVGLATGPFRIQQPGWAAISTEVIGAAACFARVGAG